MGSERAGDGFCTDGFCGQPGPGSSCWVVVSRSVWLAFTILDDSRIWSCSRHSYGSLYETHKRTFKNKIRSAQSFSSFSKNYFTTTVSACIHGYDPVGNGRFYAHALWKHF